MPNLLSNLRECFGFSQIIMSQHLIISMALKEISCRFPMGVATMYTPRSIILFLSLFIFISSCTPINISKQSQQLKKERIENKDITITTNNTNIYEEKLKKPEDNLINSNNTILSNEITVLFSDNKNENFTKQFINVLELAIHNKKLDKISFEIRYFKNEQELETVILNSTKKGKIFVGPTNIQNTKIAKKFCDYEIVFFAFSSETTLASECIFLINFFPRNELEQLFKSLNNESKVALLYPENNYGYKINSIIDNIVNNSDAVLVNRASYKNDLSNVRNAIKELGKYELRKYELERQKQILSKKSDQKSKKRLKKLNKFKTTNDYDFTHVLVVDYGLNLLQVAPLLPYYDIDPNVVQFMSTGVIDDENFFFEPSLQGTIFPGVEKENRIKLLEQYQELYNENLLRVSTLPYDLVGLLNYIYSNTLTYGQLITLLNNPIVKYDGVDGKFYFKDNMIERELDILKISNGEALKIN